MSRPLLGALLLLIAACIWGGAFVPQKLTVVALPPLLATASLGARAQEILPAFIASRAGETKDYDPRLMITTALLYATEPRRPIQQLHQVSAPVMSWLGFFGGGKGVGMALEQGVRRRCSAGPRKWRNQRLYLISSTC